MQELLQVLEQMEYGVFFYESLQFREDFIFGVEQYISKIKVEKKYQNLIIAFKIFCQLCLKSAEIQYLFRLYNVYEQIADIAKEHLEGLEEYVLGNVEKIKKHYEEKNSGLHYMRYLNDKGSFSVLRNNHFQKQSF